MNVKPVHIVIAAVLAGVTGALTSLIFNHQGPIIGTDTGQQLLHHAAPTPPDGITVPERGERVPSFSLTDLDGNTRHVPEDFTGRPLLINVWASWCAPCIREMPELDRFTRAQGENGVQVLGIALDEIEAVQAFLQEVPVSYPVVVDAPGPTDAGVRVGNLRGVLPYTALLSADGRLLKQKIGPFAEGETDTWTREGLNKL